MMKTHNSYRFTAVSILSALYSYLGWVQLRRTVHVGGWKSDEDFGINTSILVLDILGLDIFR